MSAMLLTGGTGFLGGHLRHALGGEQVVLLGRRKPRLSPNERWVSLDLSGSVAPESLSGGATLCHLAYSLESGRENVAFNRRLLDAVNEAPNVEHVILMSSTSVYGATHPSATGAVDEDSPCRPGGEYARTKLDCEKLWREGLRGRRLTVLRPTEIIGPGGLGLLQIIQDALERPALGAIKRSILFHRPLHYVAASNVAAATLFCLRRKEAPESETFVISDDDQPENSGYAAMQDAIREIVGRAPLRSPALPPWALRTLGSVVRRPLAPGWSYSSAKLRGTGFVPPIPLREEVRRLVESLEAPGLAGR